MRVAAKLGTYVAALAAVFGAAWSLGTAVHGGGAQVAAPPPRSPGSVVAPPATGDRPDGDQHPPISPRPAPPTYRVPVGGIGAGQPPSEGHDTGSGPRSP